MTRYFSRSLVGRWLLLLSIVAASMLLASLAHASPDQTESRLQGDPQSAYADVSLSPAGLTADFYLDDVLAASGVASAHLQVPPGVQTRIEARNVRDGGAGFGDLYVYENASTYVLIQAGQTRAYTLSPRKVYLKGTVELTCNIRGIRAEESAACLLAVDSVPQADILPGQKASLLLTPGVHSIQVQITGPSAERWHPAANNHSVNVRAGSTYPIRSTFNRKGLLTVRLNQPGVVGDLFVDGTLVATQASTAQVWVLPGTHKVQGRNFTDPAAAGVYRWKDTAATSHYLGSGQQRTATLTLQKEYLFGFVSVLCQINGVQPGDDVRCNAAINNSSTVIPPGQRSQINAPPGTQTLTVTLVGASANLWETSKTQAVNVRAGRTTNVTAIFNKLSGGGQPGPGMPYTGHFANVGPHLESIYLLGQQLGNNSRAFAKIGDCEAAFPVFLQGFDTGIYNLGSYQYLGSVLTHFTGSFLHVGQAADGGMSSSALLNPVWANPNYCNAGESPLACEYRRQRPSIALIMVRTLDHQAIADGRFHSELTQIVQYSVRQGVIPILSTVPYWGPTNPDSALINDVVRRVANENQIPLWDFWVTSEQLPNRGVTQDYHINDPNYTRSTYFDAESMNMAVTKRNLEALEILHALLTQVIQ